MKRPVETNLKIVENKEKYQFAKQIDDLYGSFFREHNAFAWIFIFIDSMQEYAFNKVYSLYDVLRWKNEGKCITKSFFYIK